MASVWEKDVLTTPSLRAKSFEVAVFQSVLPAWGLLVQETVEVRWGLRL